MPEVISYPNAESASTRLRAIVSTDRLSPRAWVLVALSHQGGALTFSVNGRSFASRAR